MKETKEHEQHAVERPSPMTSSAAALKKIRAAERLAARLRVACGDAHAELVASPTLPTWHLSQDLRDAAGVVASMALTLRMHVETKK